MKTTGLLFTVILLISLAVMAFQLTPQQLPPPYHTPSANNRPQVVPKPEGSEIRVPAGFQVSVFAEGFERPRFMLLGPGKEILLSDSGDTGSVYVLPDRNGDGKPDEKRKIIEGLNRPYGLALWREYLYVGEPGSVKRYKYDAKAMKAALPGEEVVSLKGLEKGHWTRSLVFDRKGEKLYVGVGSGSNVDAGEDARRAAINRYNADGSGHETYASGTRNPIGLRWYPGTDTLWAAVQERDALGDDLVPDYFIRVKQGGFYGWPYAYIGPNEDPRRKGEAPDLVKKALVPEVLLGSHVAVLDFVFYAGKMFPKEYQGGAFLAQHGSWNRSMRIGYNVVFVPFKDQKPAGPPKQFLTGFMLGPDKREVWGRPVALLELPDGSLLMSEDGGNKIWRITYRAE
ncbi:MAG: L-sorbosone dehydrogenase [Acidobacteria bacterium]|nr:MAG: L-sorbosone dehydrogenase [Acidobacteriota bacterium]